jgi:phosphoglycolate phosphatase
MTLPAYPQLRALLFDLDGTLIDSAADLAAAGNWLRAQEGLPVLPAERVASFVGDGVESLVSRLLETTDGAVIQRCIPGFKRHYHDHCLDHTRLYEGAAPVLDALKRRGYRLAVVTNKPEKVSRHILEGLGVAELFGSVVGGNTLPVKKPDPAPLRKACQDLGVPETACAMVGDSRVDVEAGRALGVPCLAFRDRIGDQRLLQAARPDRLLGSFHELLELFPPLA